MRSFSNIEKLYRGADHYTGYGRGFVWHIRRAGRQLWRVTAQPRGPQPGYYFEARTLADVSRQLANWNGLRDASLFMLRANIARILELHDQKEIDDIVAARYIGDAWREYVNFINRLEN